MKRSPARLLGGAVVLTAMLVAAAPASAGPLGLSDCHRVGPLQQCSGLVRTWDGVPLDTTVTLPAPGARDRPLIALVHGFGNSKWEYLNPEETAYTGNAYAWARAGYAVLTHTARGLWDSCGTPQSRLANAAECADGYVHLADVRYEVRDTQTLIGRLVDEGIADARRIGATGDSYGGGQTAMLAALRNQIVLPNGRRAPWRSPKGRPLRVAAAAPIIPWTDLIGTIAPNGRTLTYAVTPPPSSGRPVGVFKASVATAIAVAAQFATGPGQPLGEPFVPGRPMGYLSPPGADPQSDVIGWVTRALQGEPYDDPEAQQVVRTLQRFHSPYHLLGGRRPPPLFFASGFTDDLFPVNEAVRYVNRVKRRWPRVPVSMLLGDFGHQRASNEQRQRKHLLKSLRLFFDKRLRGRGRGPRLGVVAYPQTCPREAASGPAFFARTFTGLARGEVRAGSGRVQSFGRAGGDPQTGAAIDPVAGGGDGCVEVPAEDGPGTATYRLRKVGKPFTLLGAPAIVTRLGISGSRAAAQVIARLWDVNPATGNQRLVSRAAMRPVPGRNVFELHPAGWRFARGHVPKLELLGNDAPYGRTANGEFTVTVRRLRLRLPVRERPDCARIRRRAKPILPAGQRFAPGGAYRAPGCRRG